MGMGEKTHWLGELGRWDDQCKGAIVEKSKERLEYCGSGAAGPAVGKIACTETGRHGVTGAGNPVRSKEQPIV